MHTCHSFHSSQVLKLMNTPPEIPVKGARRQQRHSSQKFEEVSEILMTPQEGAGGKGQKCVEVDVDRHEETGFSEQETRVRT